MKYIYLCVCFLATTSVIAYDLEEYEHRVACNPEDYRALYNVGVVAFKQDDLVKAQAAFNYLKSVCKKQNWDSERCEKVNYNAGNTEIKIEQFADAVESFETVLDHNPDNKKAQEKLEFAKKMLKQQEQQQQEKQQGNDKRDDQESNDPSDEEKKEKDGHKDDRDRDSDKPDEGNQGKRNNDSDSRDEAQQNDEKKDGQDDQSHKQLENQEDSNDNTQQDKPNQNSGNEQELKEDVGQDKEPELTKEEQQLLAGLEALDRDMNKKQAEHAFRAVMGGRNEKNW